MKARLLLAGFAGLVCLTSAAQAQTVTFPAAFQNVPGTTGWGIPFGLPSARVQVATSEAKGRTFVARRIAFRRSGSFPGTATARTLRFTIDVGPTNFTKLGTTFSTNFVAAPTRAVNNISYNFPDWSKEVAFPAPFDATLAFSRPYVHRSTDDFLVDLRTDGTSVSGWTPTDGISAPFNTDVTGPSRPIGTGCIVGGNEIGCQALVRSVAGGTSMSVFLSIFRAPANKPAIFFYGLTRPNLQLPGFCTSIYTSAEFSSPVGTTNTRGLARVTITPQGAYNRALTGLRLYGQGLAGGSLSHGREVIMPAITFPAVTTRQAFATSSSATTSRGFNNGGLIFQVSTR